jgi:hypothetical protein
MELEKIYNDLIKKYTESVKENVYLEVEARFSDIDKKRFDILFNYLKSKYKYEKSEHLDFFKDSIRLTDDKLIEKNRLIWFKLDRFKLVLSEEIKLEKKIDIKQFKKDALERNKIRYSFKLNEFRVDMTIVDNKKYEIEIELLSKPTKNLLKTLYKNVIDYWKIMLETINYYSVEEEVTIINAFNNILGAESSDKLSHKVLNQARNLKIEDCVYGGLIGGKYLYTITHKANGLRKQMVIHENGLWMVYPPKQLNLVFTKNQISNLKRICTTILDGEYITLDNMTVKGKELQVENLYLVFDVMAYTGKKNVQSLSHEKRLDYARSFYNKLINDKILKMDIKKFYPLDSVEGLPLVIEELDKEYKQLSYYTDGYVITPENYKYLTEVNVKSTLKDSPEICKLKPWNELTMDLVYSKDHILLANDKEGKVPFEGSYFYPFDPKKNVQWNSPKFDKIPLNSIVEFGPIGTYADLLSKTEFNFNKFEYIILEPRRVRFDKYAPNTIEVVKSIWDDLNDPITIETLLGKTFDLAFRYQNVVKYNLLSKIPPNSDIIDIGAGNGGTLGKMRNAHHILVVEPNKEHIKELKRRANLRIGDKEPLINKLTILETGGEDTERIVKTAIECFNWKKDKEKRPLYITMMLSLSFFFGPSDLFNKLVRTFKEIIYNYGENITFLFTTIEKGRVLELIKNYGDNFKLGPITLIFTQPNELYVNIPGTIVQGQKEYLVDVNKFIDNIGMNLTSLEAENKEKFLSKPEKEWTNLFVSGIAVYNKSSPTKIIKSIKTTEETIGQSLSNLKKFDLEDLTIGKGDPYEEYIKNSGILKTSIKWGQLKLFVSELNFITRYWNSNVIPILNIVYVGAAPGTHIEILSQLFPQIVWNLYDSRSFYKSLKDNKQINIYQKLFESSDVDQWKNRKDVFFISDIRNLKYNIKNEEKENEKIAWDDMLLQQKWVVDIKPVQSLLKFRLPYSYEWSKQDSISYLDGLLYRQAWAPQSSTECRLVPYTDFRMRDWDYKMVEGMMFYYNKLRYTAKFYNPIPSSDNLGLTNDYDSSMTIFIVISYLEKYQIDITNTKIVYNLLKFILNNVDEESKTLIERRDEMEHTKSVFSLKS